MIKGIIFDIGGVIVKWDNRTYFSYLGRLSGISAKEIGRIVDNIDKRYGFERGRISVSEFEKVLAKRIEINVNRIRWFHFYRANMKVDRKVVDITRRLHRDYTTAYLSNIDKRRHSYTRRVMDTSVFDYGFASFAIGYVKPDRRIFEYAIRKMDMKPSELLFIDNVRENVEGARKAGLNAILFTGAANLGRRLKKMGLLDAKYK
ncbi:MAG: HAD family phosphatase [Candidatus Micrarchaeota archaeon]|nr:HAD family phosphatase [Candidatus Micrarchaeota archaeon]MDE1824499.1 HAD family phosphatase [Candidatus Micrarchaeota archaeon]MDE1849131.1 HAD family phosphatase [Candidatus Micrarchaeota archaeon]